MAGLCRLIRIASFVGGLVALCACGQAESDGSSAAQSGGAGTTTLGGAPSTGGATTLGGAPVVATGGNTSASGGTASGGSGGGPTTTIERTCGKGHGHRVPDLEDPELALVGTYNGRPFALRRDQLAPSGQCSPYSDNTAPSFEGEMVFELATDVATSPGLDAFGPGVGHFTLKQDATETSPTIDIEFTVSMLLTFPRADAVPCPG